MRTIAGVFLCAALGGAFAAEPAVAAEPYPDNLIREGEAAQPLVTRPLDAALETDAGLQTRLNKHAPAGQCPRPYVATWEARDGKLETDACSRARSVPLSLLFPGKQSPVEASWFTGTLKTEKSAAVLYVNAGTISATIEKQRK